MKIGTTGQICVSMLVGALVVLYAEFLWVAHHGYFLVPKAEAERGRMYDRMAVNPIDPFDGLEGVYE